MRQAGLKRVNVYVDPEDLLKVAQELGCRPSEAVRQLIDNYLLATEIDAVRRMPGQASEQVFRKSAGYQLLAINEDEDIEPVE